MFQTKAVDKIKTHILLFKITNLMHNSFILQQYVYYIMILNTFRAAPCSSSGGQIVLLQPLVSSLSALQYSGWERTAVRSQQAYCTAVYRGWQYQRL